MRLNSAVERSRLRHYAAQIITLWRIAALRRIRPTHHTPANVYTPKPTPEIATAIYPPIKKTAISGLFYHFKLLQTQLLNHWRITQFDVQFAQLLLVHRIGCIGQQTLRTLRFREGDHVAD